MEKLYYGVAYYDEYMPHERLEKDVAMMREAGINVVRIAESTWSTLEPQSGVFDFTHIDRVLAAMHAAGISVIVGTPTYAVPTWLVKAHPEVLATTPAGPNKYGPRQNMDITSPAYLFHAERVIRKLMAHVCQHPAVIGYQADNETKHYDTSGPNVQHRFVKYMKDRFSSLDALNHRLGLDYWSNRINAWEDFPSVDATINASLRGEFATFQRKLVTDFLAWQVALIKAYKQPDQFVTHNFDFEWKGFSHGIQTRVNHFDAAAAFDIAGCDIYHPSQDELTGAEIAFGGDLTRSMKRANYLVLETEAQGFASWVPYPGQLRLQAFSHLASGADMVAYWHWHSLHNAIETYWKGLLSHDFEPNPTYLEAKTVGRDFARFGGALAGLRKENRVAMLFSNEAQTAFDAFPMSFESGGPKYNDVLRRMYDALYRMNVGCDFVDPSSDNLEAYRLLVVPPLYAASDALLERLNRFTAQGGHIVYAFRSGFSDECVKVRAVRQPGIIGTACGVGYSQFVAAKGTKLKDDPFGVGDAENGLTAWLELLTPAGCDVLARYDHPYWGEYAAATRQRYGEGIATYIGCFPGERVMEKILEQAIELARLRDADQDLRFPLIVRKGINRKGQTVRYYFNYAMEPAEVIYPHGSGVELLADVPVRTGETLALEPWGVRIVVEG